MTTPYKGRADRGGWVPILKGIVVIGFVAGLLQASNWLVQADVGGPIKQTRGVEFTYLKQISNDQAGAAELTRMCARRATHKALRQACGRMRSMQLEETRKLQGRVRAWFEVAHQAHPGRELRQTSQRLTRLRSQAFERAVLQALIQHQQAGQSVVLDCAAQPAVRRAMRDTCQHIVDRQMGELAQLQTWLCQWYGECGEQAAP